MVVRRVVCIIIKDNKTKTIIELYCCVVQVNVNVALEHFKCDLRTIIRVNTITCINNYYYVYIAVVFQH